MLHIGTDQKKTFFLHIQPYSKGPVHQQSTKRVTSPSSLLSHARPTCCRCYGNDSRVHSRDLRKPARRIETDTAYSALLLRATAAALTVNTHTQDLFSPGTLYWKKSNAKKH